MDMPGRQYNATSDYRYGFNGKEKDNKDGVVQYDYGFRIYDPRLVRFKSVDPLTQSYPWYTPYQFAGNKPIWCIDLDGLEEALPKQPLQRPQLEVSESSCIGCAERSARARMQRDDANLETLKKEYDVWRANSPIGTPVPPQYQAVATKTPTNTATMGVGGYYGSNEHKLRKANWDTYGKYLPGVSDIDDGLTFIGNLKDGNYKAAAFTALFFLPGGDFLKPLKNLKGAGKLGGNACIDFSKDFMKKYAKKIGDAGGTVKKMEINMKGGWIGVGVGAESKQLSETGLHQFVEVTDKSGAVKIFDNAHPEGILKSDYLKSVAGDNGKEVMEGQKLYEKYAKEIK